MRRLRCPRVSTSTDRLDAMAPGAALGSSDTQFILRCNDRWHDRYPADDTLMATA
jgi:hypothetical protein